jgi:hypothetical protein
MALLDATLALIQAEYKKPEVTWRSAPINAKELAFLERECTKIVGFDPKGWRKEMFQRYKRGGRMEVRECDYGRVVVLYDNDDQTVPWGLWGRILRLYGVNACIYFLAHPALRQFPTSKKSIGPIHINGGYNYPCNAEEVMIYRAEDATRVLIHELQHASCLDSTPEGRGILSRGTRETEPTPEQRAILSRGTHHQHDDALEAETEAWAELLYAAVLSQGKRAVFLQLVQDQAAWFIAQNEQVKQHMKSPTQFPYRYTIAKEAVWRRWGLVKDLRTATMSSQATQSLRLAANASQSLRLTPPPSAALKRAFGVSPDSTIL